MDDNLRVEGDCVGWRLGVGEAMGFGCSEGRWHALGYRYDVMRLEGCGRRCQDFSVCTRFGILGVKTSHLVAPLRLWCLLGCRLYFHQRYLDMYYILILCLAACHRDI